MNALKNIRGSAKGDKKKPNSVLKDVTNALRAEKFARKANRPASKKGSLRGEEKKDAESWRNEG